MTPFASAQSTAGISPTSANPLLDEWSTPHRVPPYDRILAEHYEPAFDVAIVEARAALKRLSENEEPADFHNTIEALENLSPLLARIQGAFFTVAQAHATPEILSAQANVAPKLTALNSAIYLDSHLFERVAAVWRKRATLDLTPEEDRLLEVTHRGFLRAGAALAADQREQLAALNLELSRYQIQFGKNLLADQKQSDVFLTEKQLAGLPKEMLASAAAKAMAAGKPGQFLVSSIRSEVEPFLTLARDRKARETVFLAFNQRGDNGNEFDNNQLITAILKLRAERAKLLQHTHFAAFQLADSMAGTPETAMNLLLEVYQSSLTRAREEEAELLKIAARDGLDRLEPWDWRYYAEKVRAERYHFDEAMLKEYLPLNGMITAMFETTTRLFGLTFHERTDIPVYADGVRVWEVYEADGTYVGLFYGDWFTRDTKKPGAWMNSIRAQSRLLGHTPVIVNNCNYTPPAPGARATLSTDDLRVLFHEFGHALHGLLATARYPSLAGPGRTIHTDFVELPSLIYEHWALNPEILRRHAKNIDDQTIPEKLIQSLLLSQTFNQGFLTIQQLASAILDLRLHSMTDIPENFSLTAWETSQLQALGVPDSIGMRHRLAHFSHLFGGGYAAKYYSYTWSEVMSADGFEAFTETQNAFDPATALRFRNEILEVGNTREPRASYIAFRGRMPNAGALLRSRGLRK